MSFFSGTTKEQYECVGFREVGWIIWIRILYIISWHFEVGGVHLFNFEMIRVFFITGPKELDLPILAAIIGSIGTPAMNMVQQPIDLLQTHWLSCHSTSTAREGSQEKGATKGKRGTWNHRWLIGGLHRDPMMVGLTMVSFLNYFDPLSHAQIIVYESIGNRFHKGSTHKTCLKISIWPISNFMTKNTAQSLWVYVYDDMLVRGTVASEHHKGDPRFLKGQMIHYISWLFMCGEYPSPPQKPKSGSSIFEEAWRR